MKTIPRVTALSLILGLSLGAISAPVHADPVTWTLSDIVFNDGGTASGTFVYDEATQSPSAVNIQTSLGTVFSGNSYNIVLATNPNGTLITKLTLTTAADSNDFTNEFIFDLFFVGDGLSDAGGTVAINLGDSSENFCPDATCSIQDPRRLIIGGSVVADVLVNQPWDGTLTGNTSVDGITEQDVIDDFFLAEGSAITSASWVGIFFPTGFVVEPNRTFIIEFFDDTGGTPAVSPFETVVVTASSSFVSEISEFDAYSFTATLPTPVFLVGGVPYYFSVTDAGFNSSGGNGMFWGRSSVGDDSSFFRSGDAGTWQPLAFNYAFSLGSSAVSPESISYMYWTDFGTKKIQRAELDGSNVEDVVTTISLLGSLGIAVDTVTDKLYWTDAFNNKIQRSNLDGSSVEDLVTTGLIQPRGIALDVAGGKMYWANASSTPRKIQRANLDGSGVEDLVTTGLQVPAGIALDIPGGKVYWTDFGGIPRKIQRANLDGSVVEDLVTTGLDSPEGIAVDTSTEKIYWADAGTGKIQRANLDGSGVEDLVTTGLVAPRYVVVDKEGGKMYWTDSGTDKIQRANLDGSGVEDLVTTGLNVPIAIALDFATPTISQLVAKYNLDSSFVDELGGPPLFPNGGALESDGYSFGPNQGLSLSNVVNADNYSIEMLFRVDDINANSIVTKLLDFADLAADTGWYAGSDLNTTIVGELTFFTPSQGFNLAGMAQVLQNDQLAQLVVTRNGASSKVVAYVNGVEVLQFIDDTAEAALSGPNNIVHFLVDDNQSSQVEASAGFIDYIKIYGGPLTPAQVADLVPDADGDGDPDFADNCPSLFNPDQVDANMDGFGDDCVDPSVTIPPDTDVGENPSIGTGTTIGGDTSIGDNIDLGDNVTVAKDLDIGDDVTVGDDSEIAKDSVVGDGVTIGENVFIAKDVQIGAGVQIGDDCIINRGAIIGDNAVLGVGVIVGKDATIAADAVVPDGTTVPNGGSFP